MIPGPVRGYARLEHWRPRQGQSSACVGFISGMVFLYYDSVSVPMSVWGSYLRLYGGF